VVQANWTKQGKSIVRGGKRKAQLHGGMHKREGRGERERIDEGGNVVYCKDLNEKGRKASVGGFLGGGGWESPGRKEGVGKIKINHFNPPWGSGG